MNRKIVTAIIITVILSAGAFVALLAFWPSVSDQNSVTSITFTDPGIGVSMEHPSSWTTDLKDIDKKTAYFASPERLKRFSGSNEGNQFDIYLSVYDTVFTVPGNDRGLSLGEFVVSDAFFGSEPIKIGDRSGYKTHIRDDMWPTLIFIEANGKVYKIGVAEEEPSDDVWAVVGSIRFGGLEE